MDGSAAEHIHEAVPVIAGYGDVFGLRIFADQESLDLDSQNKKLRQLIDLCDCPSINMESEIKHP